MKRDSQIHWVVPICELLCDSTDIAALFVTAAFLVELTFHCVADGIRQITKKDFGVDNRHVGRSFEDTG